MRFFFLIPLLLLSSLFCEETTFDVMYANWLNKHWETSNVFPSNNDLVSAKQKIDPGLMERVCYYSNTFKLRPFASLAKSQNSKTIMGNAGLSYSFDDDITIGVEMESGKFDVHTTLTDKLNAESEFEGKATYSSIKLKCGYERIGGFLSYKQLSAPNVDIFVNKIDGTISDIYYDSAYTSKMACIGMYGRFISDNGLMLEFNNGLGVCSGTPGSDVSNQVNKQWKSSPKPYVGVGADFTVDLSYRQKIYSYGEWFLGFRGTAFGHIDAIGMSIEKGKDNPDKKFEGELRASRMDLYYGPYIGVGLVF